MVSDQRRRSEIQEDRRIELEPFRDLTPDDVARAVQQLPDGIREQLARGPERHRWSCKVCNALQPICGPEPGPQDAGTWTVGPDHPARIVLEYHEVPKLDMRFAEDQWYGEIANEVYRRCITIYRAAGWTGDAESPNA